MPWACRGSGDLTKALGVDLGQLWIINICETYKIVNVHGGCAYELMVHSQSGHMHLWSHATLVAMQQLQMLLCYYQHRYVNYQAYCNHHSY